MHEQATATGRVAACELASIRSRARRGEWDNAAVIREIRRRRA
jgi:hypothetical protein